MLGWHHSEAPKSCTLTRWNSSTVSPMSYRAPGATVSGGNSHSHTTRVVSAETTRVVCEWLFPPETVAPGARYDIGDTVELFHRVNVQDFGASEWCQPNMKSRAYRDGGVLVSTEQEIIGRWYYRWYREAMGLAEQP